MERDTGRSILQTRVDNILKEMRNMSQRRNRNAIFDRLFERSGRLNELEAVLSLAPADEDEATEVEDLLADLEVELEVEEAEGEEGGEEGGYAVGLGQDFPQAFGRVAGGTQLVQSQGAVALGESSARGIAQ